MIYPKLEPEIRAFNEWVGAPKSRDIFAPRNMASLVVDLLRAGCKIGFDPGRVTVTTLRGESFKGYSAIVPEALADATLHFYKKRPSLPKGEHRWRACKAAPLSPEIRESTSDGLGRLARGCSWQDI